MSQNIRKFLLIHIRIQKPKSVKQDKFESMNAFSRYPKDTGTLIENEAFF